MTIGAMIFKSARGYECSITGHCSCIMITAFNFIKWIPFCGMIPIVNHSGNHHRFIGHSFGHHVGGYLMLKSAHALMEITQLPGNIISIRSCFILWISIHHQTPFASKCIGSSSGTFFNIRANIGSEIILP